ncbi:putative dynamin GTPase effector, Dynamin superfamily [Helianthus annuus]|nr:putative dynamin GTPase effector, Dynamin superfamily [Helianthus annuus]
MGFEHLGKLLSKHLEPVIKSQIPGLQSLISRTILDSSFQHLESVICPHGGWNFKTLDSQIHCGRQLGKLLDEDPVITQRRQNIGKRVELYRAAQSEIDMVVWTN